MTKRELEKILKKNGWRIVSGTRHDMAVKDGTSTRFPYRDIKVIFPSERQRVF